MVTKKNWPSDTVTTHYRLIAVGKNIENCTLMDQVGIGC
ncbi:hypothetical protein L248_2016 [Schleiferilactobacillus shenzhenensis LY-73]|uniref:Uncharacterized protein n=1 Tax=Schleiferilactobacillus shenzhenensis LY-73 TaxID=1231336 RepID=U4TR57_9LACO|nr:hypothetical protein L248_2016 [Schleiferilactobacillus shenzhenensis LY-73]